MSYSNFYHHRLNQLLRQVRKLKQSSSVPHYYAVAVGRRVGIFRSWPSCKVQIDNIVNAKYCRFTNQYDALKYLETTPKEPPLYLQNKADVTKLTPVPNEEDEKDTTVVYTDGSCWRNGLSDACAAIGVYWPNSPERNVGSLLETGRQTSIRAELQAVIKALEQAAEANIRHLTIYTDSHFVIQTATVWIAKWKRNGWCCSNGSPVKNRQDMIELDQAMSKLDVIVWRPVSSHSGVKGNDEADRLANKAIANKMAEALEAEN